MKAKQAAAFYRGKERYNCAQAVLRTFQEEAGVPDSVIKAARRWGSGRVEGGMCGALYAVRALIDDPELLAKVDREFALVAGSTLCRQIRGMSRVTCRECVSLAAGLTAPHMGGVDRDDLVAGMDLSGREDAMREFRNRAVCRVL
jgi:hypothetical protein